MSAAGEEPPRIIPTCLTAERMRGTKAAAVGSDGLRGSSDKFSPSISDTEEEWAAVLIVSVSDQSLYAAADEAHPCGTQGGGFLETCDGNCPESHHST